MSCQEFKESQAASFDSQWKVLQTRKGGFWQHYTENLQKGIRYVNLAERNQVFRPYEYDSLIMRQHHLCDQGVISLTLDLQRANRSQESAVGVVFNARETEYLGLEVQVASREMVVYKKYQNTYHQIAGIQRADVTMDAPLFIQIRSHAGEISITVNRQPLITF